ncbi:hypothetical protein HO133_000425 [Letharia lupina]|uniref:C2H2-type domain-containing protein n=1 Tax=Letharia lupina TaxID=560253 RepID=A0A8H6FCN7_9LECA|nr:uncharacterized protein HO133_000425 [Letharia lupina]KAF6223582.1 hypothetical protein HO133_000425 [Letharia lupina]
MPKRSREDSPSPTTTFSLSPTPDPSCPASTDAPVHPSKYIQTSDERSTRRVMKCSLPPHHDTISFSTFEEFELHYAREHAHRCSECRKNFPTEHFLGLHISENHDPLTEARRANEEKTNYDFQIVNTGIDKRSSMLRSRPRKHSSAASRAFHREQRTNSTEAFQGHNPDSANTLESSAAETSKGSSGRLGHSPSLPADVDELVSTMSALKFVPPSVHFGRGGRRGGLSRS